MTRKNAWAGLAAAVALSLCLVACKDTKTLQENEQLKTQVADLQKQNTQMSSDLQAAIAARDALQKENDSLKARVKPKKAKHTAKKSVTRKRRKTS